MCKLESRISEIFSRCTPFCTDLDDEDSYIIDTTKENTKDKQT